MSSFLDAQPVKEEEEDAGLGWVLVGHPLRWPVTNLNLQIFLVKSAKEDTHILTRAGKSKSLIPALILTHHLTRGTLTNRAHHLNSYCSGANCQNMCLKYYQ